MEDSRVTDVRIDRQKEQRERERRWARQLTRNSIRARLVYDVIKLPTRCSQLKSVGTTGLIRASLLGACSLLEISKRPPDRRIFHANPRFSPPNHRTRVPSPPFPGSEDLDGLWGLSLPALYRHFYEIRFYR